MHNRFQISNSMTFIILGFGRVGPFWPLGQGGVNRILGCVLTFTLLFVLLCTAWALRFLCRTHPVLWAVTETVQHSVGEGRVPPFSATYRNKKMKSPIPNVSEFVCRSRWIHCSCKSHLMLQWWHGTSNGIWDIFLSPHRKGRGRRRQL